MNNIAIKIKTVTYGTLVDTVRDKIRDPPMLELSNLGYPTFQTDMHLMLSFQGSRNQPCSVRSVP